MKIQENAAFISFDNSHNGLIFDDRAHKLSPIKYYNVIDGELPRTSKDCSYYGYVYKGVIILNNTGQAPQTLTEGMFFSCTGELTACQTSGSKFILIEVYHNSGTYPETNYKAYNLFGGSIEEKGRLKYIDGCTDSLLIPPVKLGDPCLNHLHFPSNITQTQHTHPSHRIGIVAKGHGECVTPFGKLDLKAGMIFVIKEYNEETGFAKGKDGKMHPAGQHSFNTYESSMDVIAFHPDSDFGATDTEHPMINRTMIDGVSAKHDEAIRTK